MSTTGDQTRVAPLSPIVTPLLTDMYQITMAYAYWRSGRAEETATFELFFRTCPFKGQFVVFAGLDQVMQFLKDGFKFSKEDTAYLRTCPALRDCDPAFFDYLLTLDCSQIVVSALKEGTIAFPRITLISITGPLIIGQLLETTLLNLVNFPSLIATNAMRMRLAAGPDKRLLEFGLRRAQGPDGGLSASRYAYVGGFDGTSNVRAGQLSGIMVNGTHAHAFVQSYVSFDDLKDKTLAPADGSERVDFLAKVLEVRKLDPRFAKTNDSELAAFVGYAQAFPSAFLALVDTYDTLQSGLENFIVVALALSELGYSPIGLRLDSGDLAYLSQECRKRLDQASTLYPGGAGLTKAIVVASNDINEDVLVSLTAQGHSIDAFGIGTHLVTCQAQPALGCVYKLVEIGGIPRIKLSQDVAKVMVPGQKRIYRIFRPSGEPLVDLIKKRDEPPPEIGEKTLIRHPFEATKRANIVPHAIQELLEVVWDGPKGFSAPIATPQESKAYAAAQIKVVRPDIIRTHNPTPYKVSVSDGLYAYLHELWAANVPVADLE